MSKERFEAFSDGVFAVAITLLVLEIHLPVLHDVVDAQLGLALWHLWPQVLTYVISFATIGIIWLNHHAMFHLVERIDRNTLIFNMLLLMIHSVLDLGPYNVRHSPRRRLSVWRNFDRDGAGLQPVMVSRRAAR